MPGLVLIVVAAFFAGVINAVAGGGSFLSFPALIAAGISPVQANATSTVALWPASLASTIGYRGEKVGRELWIVLGITSLVGGAVGAVLLVSTSQETFTRLVPFLLLLATLLFTFGERMTLALWALMGRTRGRQALPLWLSIPAQLAVAVYGGYFGGGIGIVMLALFTLMGMTEIHQMNRLKNGLSTLLNGVAVVLFAALHAVVWHAALSMAVTGIAGGYLGAALAKRVDPRKARAGITIVAWLITAYFFAWSFGPKRS